MLRCHALTEASQEQRARRHAACSMLTQSTVHGSSNALLRQPLPSKEDPAAPWQSVCKGRLTCPLVSTYGDLQLQIPLTQSAPEKQLLVEVQVVRCSCRALFRMLASSRPAGNACSR